MQMKYIKYKTDKNRPADNCKMRLVKFALPHSILFLNSLGCCLARKYFLIAFLAARNNNICQVGRIFGYNFLTWECYGTSC